jgi:hypothetical protein
VLDFLHCQEKAGDLTIAVSDVLDAVTTSNLRIERGFTVVENPTVYTAQMKEGEAARFQWPAVYMRSTLQGLATTPTSSLPGHLLGNMRQSSSCKAGAGPGHLLGNMRQSFSCKAGAGRPGSQLQDVEESYSSSTQQTHSSSILHSWSTDMLPRRVAKGRARQNPIK